MLNIISHLETQIKRNLHLYNKRKHFFCKYDNNKKIISVNENVEKVQPSYTTCRDVKLCSYFGKQSGNFSRS